MTAPRGQRLREERQRRGLSLRDLAEEIGVSFNTLSRVERGRDCRASAADVIDAWLAVPFGGGSEALDQAVHLIRGFVYDEYDGESDALTVDATVWLARIAPERSA